MEKARFLRLMEEALELDPGTVRGDEVLEDLRWDSLAVVSFIGLVDEHLNVSLEPKKVSKCKTVPELLALLDGKIVG